MPAPFLPFSPVEESLTARLSERRPGMFPVPDSPLEERAILRVGKQPLAPGGD